MNIAFSKNIAYSECVLCTHTHSLIRNHTSQASKRTLPSS